MKKLIYLFCAGILASSCVTQAKYNEEVESEARLYEQAKELMEAEPDEL